MRLDKKFHEFSDHYSVGYISTNNEPSNEDGERIYIFEPSVNSVIELVINKLISKKRVSRAWDKLESELRSLAVWLDVMNYGRGFGNTEDLTFYNLRFADVVLHPIIAAFVQPYKVTVDGKESSPDLKHYPELYDIFVTDVKDEHKMKEVSTFKTQMDRECAAWTKERFQILADNICSMLKQDTSCLVTMDQFRKITTFTPEAPEKYIFNDDTWHCNAGSGQVPTVIKKIGLWNESKWMLSMYDGLTDIMNSKF